MSSLYLEQLLESVESLPVDLRRNFELIRELDINSLCRWPSASGRGRAPVERGGGGGREEEGGRGEGRGEEREKGEEREV